MRMNKLRYKIYLLLKVIIPKNFYSTILIKIAFLKFKQFTCIFLTILKILNIRVVS